MDRAELMAEIDRRWHLVDDIVRDVPDEALDHLADGPEAPPSGWTLGEVLLHMAGWKRRALGVAQALAGDPDQTDEAINSSIFGGWREYNDGHKERSAGASHETVRSEHAAAHRELLLALDDLPDRCLLDAEGKPRAWLRPLLAHTFDHLDADIKPALAG